MDWFIKEVLGNVPESELIDNSTYEFDNLIADAELEKLTGQRVNRLRSERSDEALPAPSEDFKRRLRSAIAANEETDASRFLTAFLDDDATAMRKVVREVAEG